MEHNIGRMQGYCNHHGLKFRPHIKTHKIPAIAKLQLAAGAVGIACQKLSEAQVFIDAGIDNIQIPYNIVGPQKTARLVEMSIYNRVTVSADHPSVIRGLAEAAAASDMAIRVMVDLETEIERTGARPAEVIELAKKIDEEEHLHFAGILVYPSNPSIRPALQEVLEGLDHAGIGVDSVSGGGTGAAQTAHEVPELTELRVGTYVFNDINTVTQGWATVDDCAMTVLATVVSRPSTTRAILDSGSKTLAADRINEGHGLILEYPDAKIYKLNEEHGFVDLSACEDTPVIGEQVHIVPVHTCVVTNLHNQIYGVRGESIEDVWDVAARGQVW
jgi:D-serine deaminase-like pyridoxal phosphate-dependent protein